MTFQIISLVNGQLIYSLLKFSCIKMLLQIIIMNKNFPNEPLFLSQIEKYVLHKHTNIIT